MPTEAKRATVAELVEAFSTASSAVVASHSGLTVAELGRIRSELRGKGISYRVVKNRLGRIAAEQAGRPELSPLLKGPSAVATPCHDHVVAAMRSARSSTTGILLIDAQKHALTPSSSVAPTYHASTNAIPRRGHGGSAASISTTGAPAAHAACATAEPMSPDPSTTIGARIPFMRES